MTGHDRSWWEIEHDERSVAVRIECSCGNYREDLVMTKVGRDAHVAAAFQSHLDSLKLRE